MKNKFKRIVFLTVGMVSVGQLYAQNSVITGSRTLRGSGPIIEVTDADRIPITGGSASSFQPNMNIDKSYDKDYTTLYHFSLFCYFTRSNNSKSITNALFGSI